MVKKSKVGLGTLGCLTTIVGLSMAAIGPILIQTLSASPETEGAIGLASTCLLMIGVGAGIIMMIIGFIRRSREKAIEAAADEIIQINEKIEEKRRNREK